MTRKSALRIASFATTVPLPAILCTIVLIALFPVLNAGFVGYDDAQYVLQNPALRGSWLDALAFSPGYYHPVVTLVYKAEFSMFGLSPLPYHITSLAIHLANCVSVFYLFSLLGWHKKPAFLGALLFGIHPVHVEAVAWISGRKELLWGLFSFWTMICYLKYIDTGKNKFYIVSLFMFALAVLSKPFALMLVLVIPLADYYRKRAYSPLLVLEKVPYLVLAFSLFLLSWGPSGFLMSPGSGSFNLYAYLAGSLKSLLFYVGKLVLPVNLSAIYPPPALPATTAGWFLPVLLPAAALYGAYRILRGPGKDGPVRISVFCMGFFLMTVFPALLVSPPADRYGYVPAAGIFFLYSVAVWGLYEYLVRNRTAGGSDPGQRQHKNSLFPARALIAIVAAHCLVLGGASFKRASVWKDTFSFSNDVLSKYPAEAAAYCIRAGAHRAAGRYPAAVSDFDRCLELRPDNWEGLSNRALTLLDMGEFDRAIADCGAAIRANPGSAQMYLHRGIAYQLKGDYLPALMDYDRALKISPAYLKAAKNRQVVLEKLKRR